MEVTGQTPRSLVPAQHEQAEHYLYLAGYGQAAPSLVNHTLVSACVLSTTKCLKQKCPPLHKDIEAALTAATVVAVLAVRSCL